MIETKVERLNRLKQENVQILSQAAQIIVANEALARATMCEQLGAPSDAFAAAAVNMAALLIVKLALRLERGEVRERNPNDLN
jgi:hypothetical protein